MFSTGKLVRHAATSKRFIACARVKKNIEMKNQAKKNAASVRSKKATADKTAAKEVSAKANADKLASYNLCLNFRAMTPMHCPCHPSLFSPYPTPPTEFRDKKLRFFSKQCRKPEGIKALFSEAGSSPFQARPSKHGGTSNARFQSRNKNTPLFAQLQKKSGAIGYKSKPSVNQIA